MWNYTQFATSDLIYGNKITENELIKTLNKLLLLINNNKEKYVIIQHLIWPRYDTIENIKLGVMKYGLDIKSIGLASTTKITGNTRTITPRQIMDYHYDMPLTALRHNLGFAIPLTIIDEFGRRINYALDYDHPEIPWREGKMCAIIDFVAFEKKSISNTYSLFNLDLNSTANEYSYQINRKALPFLSKEEKKQHFLEVSKIIKKILVNKYKIMTEKEYNQVPDLNPYINKLIMQEYKKVKNEIYANPDCWLEP